MNLNNLYISDLYNCSYKEINSLDDILTFLNYQIQNVKNIILYCGKDFYLKYRQEMLTYYNNLFKESIEKNGEFIMMEEGYYGLPLKKDEFVIFRQAEYGFILYYMEEFPKHIACFNLEEDNLILNKDKQLSILDLSKPIVLIMKDKND